MPLIEINPAKHTRPPFAAGAVAAVDRAIETFAMKPTASIKTALTAARKLADRDLEIEADQRRLRAPAADGLADAYRSGEATLDDVVTAAIRSTVGEDPNGPIGKTAFRTLDDARRQLARETRAVLAKPGDDWIRAIRPEFDRRLAVALGIVPRVPGRVVDEISARAHNAHRAWLHLVDAIDALDEIHTLVDGWRNAGYVPVRGAVPNDDLRWLPVSRLNGSTRVRPWFFVHNIRAGVQHGLFTETELARGVADTQPLGAA